MSSNRWPIQIVRGCALSLLCIALSSPASAAKPLPLEKIPHSLELADEYPDSWVFAHDFNFAAIVDGKVAILDAAADTRPYKGHIDAGQFASFLSAKTRPELYTAQTFLSRRTYGERVDTITIFDRKTLSPQAEIILPPKRMQVVTHKNSFQLTPDESWAFVMNFTPRASVTVVDMIGRKVLSEIEVPGCNFVFPTGKRSFSSLCSDGALATFTLKGDGSLESSTRTESFIDIDTDPLYAKNAVIDGITYFPSFRGRVQPIDFRANTPRLLPAWSLLDDEAAAEKWAPGGWQVIDGNDGGRLYVLMHKDASEGSHKHGGTEVWAYEAATGKRLARIPLERWGVSVAVTRGDTNLLVVTNENMELDVYDALTGKWLRTLHLNMAANPMVVSSQ